MRDELLYLRSDESSIFVDNSAKNVCSVNSVFDTHEIFMTTTHHATVVGF